MEFLVGTDSCHSRPWGDPEARERELLQKEQIRERERTTVDDFVANESSSFNNPIEIGIVNY